MMKSEAADFSSWLEVTFCDKVNTTPNHPTLREAMCYAFCGGKHTRARLLFSFGTLCSYSEESLLPLAHALESIHSYSLIHDDLPALDNDDVRRGKPSCHKKFGEAVAILTGDALHSFALQCILDSAHLTEIQKQRACQVLISLSGVSGMIQGQMMDLYPLPGPEQQQKDTLKTAQLFRAAAALPIALGDPHHINHESYLSFATEFGKLFQVLDDIEDNNDSSMSIDEVTRRINHLTTNPAWCSALAPHVQELQQRL